MCMCGCLTKQYHFYHVAVETDLQAGANHRFEVNQIEKKKELAISRKFMKRESQPLTKV